MKLLSRLLSASVILALAMAPLVAEAQVFDPLSKSAGGAVSGSVLYVGPLPSVTGTGSPVVIAGSTNTVGQVTAGASATSIILTFGGGGFVAVPACIVNSETQLAAFSYVVTKTTITITQTATSGNQVNWRCDPLA